MNLKLVSLVSLVSFAAVLACSALPAHAIGQLADVTQLDRDSGATLAVHLPG